jgi:ubiquinone/menaquinone biosynthesis C-methylase UbiE
LSRWRQFLRNDDDRRKWQNPEAILKEIGLKNGFTFIDLGCGGGFFSIPAALIVGEQGRVYALDADAEAIEITKGKATAKGLRNLIFRAGKAEEEILCSNCADIVFFGNVLHDFENPSQVLANCRKVLRPAGRLIDLDWKAEPMELGPPLEIRFSTHKASELIKAAGFEIVEMRESGPFHYIIEARTRQSHRPNPE